jgi:uncharacterized phage-associated protein
MSLDGRAVANFVLDFCDMKGRRITNLSLQKIVYFCHVWSLIRLNRPLIKHQFEAWKFGPVLQYLYREFREFDNQPIIGRAKKIDPKTGHSAIAEYTLDNETEELLSRVADFYSLLPPADLVQMSHAKGGPWDKVWNHQGRVNPGMKIDNGAIIEFYSKVNFPFVVQ